jgi:hypothetical protein
MYIRLPVILAMTGILLLCGINARSADRPRPGPYYEDSHLLVKLVPRTPTQMAAFYEARGFPPEALDRIRQTCFMTLVIENRSKDVLWVDLGQWKFSSDGEPVTRLDGSYWQQQWNAINLRQASRSTFGWTQFPQLRDLQPDETVGGNLVLPGNIDRVTIDAVLQPGKDREDTPVRLGFGNIECAKDTPSP